MIGNLTSKTDRNGNVIAHVGACPERSRRNALNRLTHKGYPDSTAVDYVYDLVGKIKQATDPTGTYGFAGACPEPSRRNNTGRMIGRRYD